MPRSIWGRMAVIVMWTLAAGLLVSLLQPRPGLSVREYAERQRLLDRSERRTFFTTYVRSLTVTESDAQGRRRLYLIRQPTIDQMEATIGRATGGDHERTLIWRDKAGNQYMESTFERKRLRSVQIQWDEGKVITIARRGSPDADALPRVR